MSRVIWVWSLAVLPFGFSVLAYHVGIFVEWPSLGARLFAASCGLVLIALGQDITRRFLQSVP
jgi:hypothetical protein